MKGKYVTTQILLACLSKPQSVKKDVHAQLKETIAEHRKIQQNFLPGNNEGVVLTQKKAA